MIVADAGALIAHLDAGDAHHDSVERILLDLADHPLGSSTITHAEVLVGPAAAGRLEEAMAALEALGIEELGLGPDAAPRLAALRAETGLKLPDCCVLLAARDTPPSALLTFDERLSVTARRYGLHVHGAPG